MKCPIFLSGVKAGLIQSRATEGDCLENACAWWKLAENRCAVLDIAYILDHLKEVLEYTQDHLPKELSG